MAAISKAISADTVKYLCAVAGALNGELAQEAVETLAAEGMAVIRQRIGAAVEEAGAGLLTAGPGPDGVGRWLARFGDTACDAVTEGLSAWLPGRDHLLYPYESSGFLAAFDTEARSLAAGLTKDLDDDLQNCLPAWHASLDRSARQARRVDRLVEWTWARGVGRIPVHPWLQDLTLKLEPHSVLMRMLDIDPQQVAARCREQWRQALSGLLDQVARRLTSEISILWAKRLYACLDHQVRRSRTAERTA